MDGCLGFIVMLILLSIVGWVIDLIVPGKMPYGWVGGIVAAIIGGIIGGFLSVSSILACTNVERLHTLLRTRSAGWHSIWLHRALRNGYADPPNRLED